MTPDGGVVKVLLVEDNPGDAVLIQATLEESRWLFDVTHCERLQDAVAVLEDRRFDVALVDLGLPDSSGHATYATLTAAAPTLPIVVLTGLDDDETADAALRAGAQDYLVKSGSVDDVVARAIRHAIERQRLAASVERHHQQRSALVELGRVALSGASAADLAQRAADLVASALEVDSAAVADHDRERNVLIVRGPRRVGATDQSTFELPADETSLGGACLASEHAIVVEDIVNEGATPFMERMRQRGLRSAVCVPIPDGGSPVGVLAALSRSPGRFEAGDVEFLEAVANLLSEAQHRRASESALHERMKERAALYAVTRALVEHDDRSAMGVAVAEALASGMSSPEDAVAIVAIDGVEVSSDAGRPLSTALAAAIETQGAGRGSLQVGYAEPRPLLPEEQQMLDDAARTISLWLERDDALRAARGREAFLAHLLAQVPGITWTFDRDLRLRSARGTRLVELGLTEDELVGRHLREVLTVETDETLSAHQTALAGTAGSYQYAAGGKVWQAHVEPLLDENGNVEGVVGSSIDVTDTVRTQRELFEHQQQLSAILEQLPIGVWTTDADLRFTSVLGSVVDDIEQAHEDIVGKRLTEYFGADPAGEESIRAHRSALTGESSAARLEWRGVVFQVRVEPLRDEAGRIVGTAGVGLDVTDLHRAQRDVEEREQRFSSLLEHAPDVVAILDRDGRLTYGSPALLRLSGWSAEEYAELDPWQMLHPDDRESADAFWAQVLGTGDTVGPVTYRIKDRRGRYRHVEAVYTNRLGDPAVRGVICNIHDVTVQRSAERSLRDSEARFRRLADNAPDIMFRMSLDPDAKVEYVSPAVETITGYTVQECYDDPDLALQMLAPSDHDVVAKARKGQPPTEPVQLRLRRKDGSTTWTEVRFVPVTDDRGKTVGIEGIARDISQGKLAEETLRGALERERQAARDLRQLDAMKNGFLQAVSHELRTPLTAVVGFSALLERRDRLDDERYQHLVSRLGANANRLQRLLTDLLDVDRMTRATLEPQRTPSDARDIVSRIAEDMIEEGLLVHVHGDSFIASIDAAKTERIVENLLRNAGKHAPGQPVDVTVDHTPEGLLIAVEDRGPGVPDTLKAAVFEPFRQGDTDASKVGGLGIGLSVVQTFARLHGGRAWVEDRPGGGASFRVLLPEANPSPAGEQLGHLGMDELESGPGTDHDLEVADPTGIVEADHVDTVDA